MNHPKLKFEDLDLYRPEVKLCMKDDCYEQREGTKYCGIHANKDRHTGNGRKLNRIKKNWKDNK